MLVKTVRESLNGQLFTRSVVVTLIGIPIFRFSETRIIEVNKPVKVIGFKNETENKSESID